MKHYSEANLLELHYGGERDSAAQHLSECSECTGRFVSVRLKLLSARSAGCATLDAKPSTFWARQRVAITRAIDAKHALPARRLRSAPRLAIAATLIAVLSVGVVRVANQTSEIAGTGRVAAGASPVARTAAAEIEIPALTSTQDPWDTAELQPFREVVEWESWVDAEQQSDGTL